MQSGQCQRRILHHLHNIATSETATNQSSSSSAVEILYISAFTSWAPRGPVSLVAYFTGKMFCWRIKDNMNPHQSVGILFSYYLSYFFVLWITGLNKTEAHLLLLTPWISAHCEIWTESEWQPRDCIPYFCLNYYHSISLLAIFMLHIYLWALIIIQTRFRITLGE